MTYVSLAAFLAANAPTGTAAWLHCAAAPSPAASPCTGGDDCHRLGAARHTSAAGCPGCEGTCPVCRGCGGDKACFIPAEISPMPAGQAHGSPCPCCPCPGGCAFCSVAKVPCCLAGVPLMAVGPDLGHRLAEACLLLPPTHAGKLIRPPRA